MTDAEALRILFPDLPPLPHDDECECGICWRSLCPCCWEDVAWSIEILREDPTRTREQALEILTQRYYPNAPQPERARPHWDKCERCDGFGTDSRGPCFRCNGYGYRLVKRRCAGCDECDNARA